MSRIMIKDEDFAPVLYARLGVEPMASDLEIKKAYKKLSMKYHPDRRKGYEDQFLAIGRAYEVLKNVREEYDRELTSRGYSYTYESGENKGETVSDFTSKQAGAARSKHSFQKSAAPDEFNSFRENFGYTDEDIERYKAAASRMANGDYKNGDLSTVFNFHAGSGHAFNNAPRHLNDCSHALHDGFKRLGHS